MVSSTQTLLRLRLLGKVVNRTFIVLLALWTSWRFLDSLAQAFANWFGSGTSNWIYTLAWSILPAIPPLILIAVLILAERHILRWWIPAENPACPGCGFAIDLSSPTITKCPECGLILRDQAPRAT